MDALFEERAAEMGLQAGKRQVQASHPDGRGAQPPGEIPGGGRHRSSRAQFALGFHPVLHETSERKLGGAEEGAGERSPEDGGVDRGFGYQDAARRDAAVQVAEIPVLRIDDQHEIGIDSRGEDGPQGRIHGHHDAAAGEGGEEGKDLVQGRSRSDHEDREAGGDGIQAHDTVQVTDGVQVRRQVPNPELAEFSQGRGIDLVLGPAQAQGRRGGVVPVRIGFPQRPVDDH